MKPRSASSSLFISVFNLAALLLLSPQTSHARIATTTPTPTPYPTPVSPQPPVSPRVSSNYDAGNIFITIPNSLESYKKETIHQPTIPEALCNDGTEAIYFIKKGFGAGSKRWIIWTEGGGGCSSDDPTSPAWCGLRAGTGLTSSAPFNGITSLGTMPGMNGGILDKDGGYNPDFHTYNLVNVHYCSSDMWRGAGKKRVVNRNTGEQWWFSGQKIIEALLLDLKQKYAFDQAENIILTGSSAGGAGITMNSNLIKSKYPTKDIVTIIDAVWLMNYPVYYNNSTPPENRSDDLMNYSEFYRFIPMAADADCEKFVLSQCSGTNVRCADTRHLCILPSIGARFLKVPFYMTGDQLDNALLGIYGLNRCTDRNPAEYMPWLSAYLTEFKRTLDERATGYFAPRSGNHGLDVTWAWSAASLAIKDSAGRKTSMRESFAGWYFNRPGIATKLWAPPVEGKYPHEESNVWTSSSGCPATATKVLQAK